LAGAQSTDRRASPGRLVHCRDRQQGQSLAKHGAAHAGPRARPSRGPVGYFAMSSTGTSAMLSDSDWLRVEAVLERFEAVWRGDGAEPRIEDFLPHPNDSERRRVVEELIKIDLEYRWRRGDRPLIEEYLVRFSELSGANGPPIELLKTELRVRKAA